MLTLLSEAGRSFLRAFGASLLVLLPGVLAAPNLDGVKGIGVAALIASLAAGLKAIQVFVPQLSFAQVFKGKLAPYYTWADSFVRAFLATLVTLVLGILQAPDFSLTKSAVVAVIVAAVTAGIRAVQGLLTPGDVPTPQSGISTPPPPPAVANQ